MQTNSTTFPIYKFAEQSDVNVAVDHYRGLAKTDYENAVLWAVGLAIETIKKRGFTEMDPAAYYNLRDYIKNAFNRAS